MSILSSIKIFLSNIWTALKKLPGGAIRAIRDFFGRLGNGLPHWNRRIFHGEKALVRKKFVYMPHKFLHVVIAFSAVFCLLVGVLIYQCLVDPDAANKKINNNYSYSATTLEAPRGDILAANGEILATSVAKNILIVEPAIINSTELIYEIPGRLIMENIFGMSGDEFSRIIHSTNKVSENGKQYCQLQYLRYVENPESEESEDKTYATDEQVQRIESIQEGLSSSDKSKKREAIAELFQITPDLFDEIRAEINAQQTVEGFWNKLLVKFRLQDAPVVDYASIAMKYDMSMDEIKALAKWRSLRVVGIWFETEYERVYPNNTLACKVLGYYAAYHTDSSMGLEKYYDTELNGIDGSVVRYMNSDYNLDVSYVDAVKGNTLVTTLDLQIQRIVEEQIQIFMEEIGAENVGVICMDPSDGSILAMAENMIYDPNNISDISAYYSKDEQQEIWEMLVETGQISQDLKDRIESGETIPDLEKASVLLNYITRNFCISDTYEPGSTFKPLTVAMAYEEGLVNDGHTFICDGFEEMYGYRIKCHVNEGHGSLQLYQSLTESCNDYLMHIVEKVGPERFYTYRCQYRIGSLTGIDLPGEASASTLNFDLDELHDVELATSSFGQGFNTTMVQMASAICATINGGYYYTPHLVKEVRDGNQMVISVPSEEPVTQVISEKTSEYIRDALLATVDEGTAGYVKIAGYELGGKTGTAEKGERGSGNYVISLASFVPGADSDVFLYVVIDQPDLEDQNSSKWAQLLSKRIWMELLPYLNIHSSIDGNDYIDPGESGDDPDIPDDGYDGDGSYIEDVETTLADPEAGEGQEGESPEEENPEGEVPDEDIPTEETTPSETPSEEAAASLGDV